MDDPTGNGPAGPPQVRTRRRLPAGLLPPKIQSWAVLGIAAVMVGVIGFSGNRETAGSAPPAPATAPGVVDADQERIREYRSRIERDARLLAAEQERLRSAKQAVELAASRAAPQPTAEWPPYPAEAAGMAGPAGPPATAPGEAGMRQPESRSLFASNIALSRRGDSGAPPAAPIPGSPLAAAVPELAQLLSRAPADRQDAPPQNAPPQNAAPQNAAPSSASGPAPGLCRIHEGTVLEAVLTNRLDGAFSGPVHCMVTTDVYSRDGRHVLVPRGSRALGEASRVEAFGQKRLAVAFHRLILPDGSAVVLERAPGLDASGATGLRDRVDNHYFTMFGASLAVGALSGLAQAGTQYGAGVSSEDAYRQGASRSLGDSAVRILDRFTNILPTFTVREGHRVRIYLTADLDLPPCAPRPSGGKGGL